MELVSCSQCGRSCKPGRNNGSQTHLCSQECRRAFRRAYYKRWSEANRDVVLERMRDRLAKWRADNPDYFKKHYIANREHKKRLHREWYARNADRALKVSREYNERNPDLIRALSRRKEGGRRARLLEAFVEAVDPQVVFQRDKGVCGICKLIVAPSEKWEVDHVVPLKRGGIHAYSNVQLAHRRCNRSKGARVT